MSPFDPMLLIEKRFNKGEESLYDLKNADKEKSN